MSGNKIGGVRAAATNYKRHGADFYKRIGAKGGSNGHTGGFASMLVGADGLTGRERARKVGALGGHISKRGQSKKEEQEEE